MIIQPLPPRRRRTKKRPPRSWVYAPLLHGKAPPGSLELWRLGPDHHVLERVTDWLKRPVSLETKDTIRALHQCIHAEGFYRVISRENGRIRRRHDYQAAHVLPPGWSPKTARSAYTPVTPVDRLACENAKLKGEATELRERIDTLEAERRAVAEELETSRQRAQQAIAEAKLEAKRRVEEANRDREAAEALIAKRDAELKRMRGILAECARAPEGAEADAHSSYRAHPDGASGAADTPADGARRPISSSSASGAQRRRAGGASAAAWESQRSLEEMRRLLEEVSRDREAKEEAKASATRSAEQPFAELAQWSDLLVKLVETIAGKPREEAPADESQPQDPAREEPEADGDDPDVGDET